MKYKIILITLFWVITTHANNPPHFTDIQSTVISNMNGTATFTGKIKAIDTIVIIPGHRLKLDFIDTLTFSGLTADSVILAGDSMMFEFTVVFDTSNLPVFPKDQFIFIDIILSNGDTITTEFWAHLFFAPWNELEIFNHSDFKHCGRRWRSPLLDSTLQRTYIPYNNIPSSTWIEPDTNSSEWEYVPQYASNPNLPFDVQMKAVHPDSLQFYSDYYGDSVTIQNSFDSIAFIIGTRYQGTIKGRLYTRMENDLGIMIDTMPLSGILVELKESDMGDMYRVQIAESHTDSAGFFNLDYDTDQPFEGGEIELFLHITAKNKDFNFKVVDPLITGVTLPSTGMAEEEIIRLSPQPEGDVGIVQLGSIELDNVAMHVCHWTENAFRYAENNNMDVGLFGLNNLMVLVNCNNSFMLPNSNTWISDLLIVNTVLLNPTIRLDRIDGKHENTIYHEWGHFFMWKIQNRGFINRYDDDDCLFDFGDHSWSKEDHLRLAWTEGFADAMQMILDGAYWKEDLEYGYENEPSHSQPRSSDQNWDPYEIVERFSDINNGLKSEYYLACAIYDLWDGQNKGLPNPELGKGLFGRINRHPYNDRDSMGNYYSNGWLTIDKISLSFETLMLPLKNNSGPFNGLKNIYEYYDYLLNTTLEADCISRRLVAECFRENRIVLDYNSFINEKINSNPTGTWKDNNISLNSDIIYEIVQFEDEGNTVLCEDETDYLNVKVNPVEEIENHVTNYPFTSSTQSELVNGTISDDLKLGFNFPNSPSTFNLNSGEKTISSGVNLQTCGDVIWEFGNTEINIGSHNEPSAAIHFNAGSTFSIGDSTVIKIANNSTLTIEEGATLRIGPNTQIILDGSNAVLEIKGTLILEEDACFCPTGGSNGQGFVRFNMPGISNANDAKDRIQLGNGSSLQFSGTSSTHKLIEVTDHVLWLDNNADNTKLFSIENGMIEMGEDAVLNLGIRSVLDYLTITPMSGADDFHGIYLWGHRNTINYVNIENSRNGLKSYNVVGGFPLLAKNLTLDDCESGLWVEGKGLVYNTGEIKNGNSAFGIHATGMDIPSFLQSIQVNNVDEGVSFTGNKTAALSVTGSTFQVAVNGLDYLAPGSLYSRCSNYYGSNTGTGMRVAAGTLEMSNAFSRSGGGNRFYNTTTQDAFNKSVVLLAAPLFLHNGINDLKFNSGAGNYALFGRTRDVTLTGLNATIKAAQNFWALPTNDTPQHNVNMQLFQDNAYLVYIITIDTPTNHFSLQTTYDNARNSYCAQSGSKGGNAGTGYAMYANPRSITWQNPNQNVKDVFEEILTDQYDTLNTDNLIPDWETALTAPEWNSGMVPVDWYYIDIGINKMNELAALYLSQDTTFLEQPDSTHNHLVSLKNVLNHWAQRSDTSSDSAAMLLSQHIRFAKAGFYTLVNDYAKALTIYTSLASNADSSLFPLAEYWICQLYRMNQIKETGTHYMFVDSLEPCTAVYPENYPEPFRDDVKTLDVPKPELVMYPNPAGNTLNVLFETAQSATIQIIDPIGKVVLEKSTNTHSQPWEIDISSLPAGMYVVKYIMEDRQKVITLPLVKM